MPPKKVHFTKELETLLFTLYGKALDSAFANPVLQDPWAEAAVRNIDDDLGKHKVSKMVFDAWNHMALSALVHGIDLFPTLRRMNRVLHYQF